ncbi:serine/threonine-protein kinase PAK 5-like [Cyanistes caeruleus]|uniref:serine/threonine-protein kinase PAK 5-like n=1 Tax=Cyanistes caeruleus TaxID=156563 RepID=UPI000CDB75E6|nr:serine/threonine-protein kinase PAK 5-like [Cyanistes caeruleus]
MRLSTQRESAQCVPAASEGSWDWLASAWAAFCGKDRSRDCFCLSRRLALSEWLGSRELSSCRLAEGWWHFGWSGKRRLCLRVSALHCFCLSGSVVSPGEPGRKYTALEELGRGGFGAVYRALDASTGKQVAIKKMTLQEEDSEELAVNEILAMRDNRNPNIVTYLDSYLVDEDLWLVMEFMDRGTLFDVLRAAYLEEEQIGCREVRDGACAGPGLHRMVLASGWGRRAEVSCSLLCFGAAVTAPGEE